MVETGAFGETLRRVREERGVPLDIVATATRIARHHLDALERGDLESLPSGPFGRSYLRSYAEFLGIDPEPMLHAYRSQEADRGLGPAESRERAIRELAHLLESRPEPKRFPPLWLPGAIVFAALIFALWRLSVGSAPVVPAPERLVETPQAAASTPEPPTESGPGPEPPPEKAPTGAAAISVSESALGTGVVDHAPTGVADRFHEGERVLFWTRVVAAKPGGVIRHYWLHEGKPVMRADLQIGGSHWRTFSRLTLPEGASGNWAVEARDETGRVLAREQFLCLE